MKSFLSNRTASARRAERPSLGFIDILRDMRKASPYVSAGLCEKTADQGADAVAAWPPLLIKA
jgi:hypothetical protein